jgi:DNA processing protein
VREACDQCLRRSWLLSQLGGHLDRAGSRLPDLLALGDAELISAVGGRRRATLERRAAEFSAAEARQASGSAGLAMVCRCHPLYPSRLQALPSPPAVLHVSGNLDGFLSLVAGETVAVVGTRRPSNYGLDVARTLARSLGTAGLPVISGMAHGIDSAAHDGSLSAQGATVAVLPAGPERSHPVSRSGLRRRIVAAGAAISELPPGSDVWRWMFPARNRVIAGLSAMTVVIEAGQRSGALLTASWAQTLGRPIGAVPGRITSPQAHGPHRLLKDGAHLITSAQDVLDVLYGAGTRQIGADDRLGLDSERQRWLIAIADGHDTPAGLARHGLPPERSLQVLSELELSGHIRREAGGRFSVRP